MQDRNKGSRSTTQIPNNNDAVFITREGLARRWSVSVRTIDRRRRDGILAWVDLNNGRGSKPIVRFPLKTIEEYEQRATLEIR